MGDIENGSAYWMRAVSFAGLHRVLHALAEYPAGLRASEFDRMVIERDLYRTRAGTVPKRTTLYHCRNTLLRVSALLEQKGRYVVNHGNAHVRGLLSSAAVADLRLPEDPCSHFSELVVGTGDCRAAFFDLFMPTTDCYSAADFRQNGVAVQWSQVDVSPPSFALRAVGGHDRAELLISSPSHVKAVLHGMRYWARDELGLVDEFAEVGGAMVMYPLRQPFARMAPEYAASDVIESIAPTGEWTTVGIRELIRHWCVGRRQVIAALLDALRWLEHNCAGHVVLVPTSLDMATFGARAPQSEQLELRSYYMDRHSRYVSHIRLHETLWESDICQTI